MFLTQTHKRQESAEKAIYKREVNMAVFSINGVICDAGKATISVMDHGFLYGDGVFEGLRFYRQKILKLSAHLYRLKDSATALGIELPVTLEEIKSALDDVIRASAEKDGYIRLIVTRGVGPLGIDPRQCKPGSLVIIADKLSMMSQAVLDQGAKLIIAGTRRYSPDQLDSRIKSLNYLNQIQGRIEANAAGADEAVLLNQAGFVAEGTADNLFIVRNGVLLTPPVKDGALDGITRGIILELAEQRYTHQNHVTCAI